MCSHVSGEVWARNSAGERAFRRARMMGDGVGHDRSSSNSTMAAMTRFRPEARILLGLVTTIGDAALLEGADHLGRAHDAARFCSAPPGSAAATAAIPTSPA